MLRPDFTLDELLQYIQQPEGRAEGYHTCWEWAERLGVPHSRVLKILKEAHRQQKLLTCKEYREAMDGSRRCVPVYGIRSGE